MPTFDTASAIVSAKSTIGRHLLHIEAYSAAEDLATTYPSSSSSRTTSQSPPTRKPPSICSTYTQSTGFRKYLRSTVAGVFVCKHGILTFIRREVLEASEYLVDDCFMIRCDVTVKRRCYTENRGHVPPSDLHRHLGDLLASKEGADVTFQVAAETFSAHRSILAARSRVLKAKLLGRTTTGTGACCVIRISDMLPRVFEAFLHFVYTDSLPAEVMMTGWQDDEDDGSMAYHLLEAADRYDMQRLKLICEEKLCWQVEINTAATMLMFAQQHRCHRLREACVDFLRCPHALNAVMATEGFQHLVQSCPALLKDLISKLARVD
ncbi:BTB/POZ and MATH domain-containing protein 2 [Sorghum bicolor]|uniref:BTB/POZ and MATH domain-containing protein 2 n=1 Tax=Sorghum bicolor TaxID=4558 RepID=UPI000B4266AB|nr:BTB/POZ and MATH domain-containing protein 2 [Sorghum bicolor]|eukprot:XP_021305684.1 BTB/POZ and MATH domain-containing protein 2 [Sorghum bicolor]